ncbi:XRE family transcriptional regulator [Paenibacillus oralis]|uniref:XRE family transcriptional regulator n=1 Tax=Paenibacillus oralis TaxID=2490856 RepID=A0A3P3UEH6_9BACL|nr:helix-turn-helix transcriptional regulator [Paenibacillus oralis]RRJ66843.1 XRE family transcriptional regulator [Paenibacillus oralis]
MRHAATILTEINEYMQKHELNLTRFAKEAGINTGTVSAILNGNRPLAVEQLERLTKAMGHPRGHFYEKYIREYLYETNPDWRRVGPLIRHCAELDKLDSIREIVGLLLDYLFYAPLLFDLAEEFYEEGKYAAAEILYENVAMSERNQHSERLAMCQYRLFLIRQGTDQELNYQAAIQFEPFVERLDEMDQLDALRDLASAYRALRRWDKVEKIIQMLELKAKICYFSERHQRAGALRKTSRPLFYYLAYTYLLRSNVCELRGDYEQALRFNQLYIDLSWVKENDKETQHWKNQFQEWGHVNTLLIRLSSGDVSVLPDYVANIEPRKDEIVLSLLNIMEAANRYDFKVDDVLQCFEEEIKSIATQPKALGVYSQQMISDRVSRLLIELAAYYLRKGKYSEGFKYLIDSLEKYCSLNINTRSSLIKYVELFERYKSFASPQVAAAYQDLIDTLK